MQNRQTKHPATSRTLWINVVAGVVVELIANLPMLEQHLPADFYAYAFYGLAAVNAGLRLVTTQPLRLTRRHEGEHE